VHKQRNSPGNQHLVVGEEGVEVEAAADVRGPGRVWHRLTEARLAGGDLEGALDAANNGAGLLEDSVRSVRALDRLKEFSAQLEPRRAVPSVREFRERLQALAVAA
jgi:hypothetical protein